MFLPIVGIGQIRIWQSKDFHNVDSTQRISYHEGKIVAIMTFDDCKFAKGIEMTKKEYEESLNTNKSISITDQTIKEYIDWCHKDSIYVEYWKPNPSPHSTDSEGRTITLSIYIEPTLVKEYKHKEPTFVGFYEWLKDKKK